MIKNDHIPVLTDLIEKGIEIDLSELGLDSSQDLILDVDDREEPEIDITQLELENDSISNSLSDNSLSDNPVIEKMIRQILDEHMELAVQEIKLAIQQTEKTSTDNP